MNAGTKFRLSCASCGATFFSPDRRARYCPKCVKKKGSATPSRSQSSSTEAGSPAEGRPRKPLLPLLAKSPAKEKAPKRIPKATELTPEFAERVKQIYEEQYKGKEVIRKDIVSKISDELWLSRKVISKALPSVHQPKVEVPPEVKTKIIETYKGYVERGERPEGGRRRTISKMVDVPFGQVRDIVYEYSLSQYQQSAVPDPTREQKFQLEKLFWTELDKARYPWEELPEKLSQQSGLFTPWQVLRWMDMLFDEEERFDTVADVEPKTKQKILDGYQQYLAAPAPPERGLHHIIAEQVGDVTSKQVHKVLQHYRNQRRAEYSPS